MEEIRIIDVDHYHNEDFDELTIRIKPKTEPALCDIVDDERNFFLEVTAKSHEVVGATILEADHWFDELADAFQRRDLTHPDVRFFFEQKISVFAAQWAAEQHTETLAPPQPEPWRVAPVDELAPTTNKVVETQPA